MLGPIVLSGDLALAACVINGVIASAGPDVVRRHWPADAEVLDVVTQVLLRAERWLGGRQWRRIRRILNRGLRVTRR